MRDEDRRGTRLRERRREREQRPAHAYDRREWTGLPVRRVLHNDLRALELGAPPAQPELGCNSPTLCEAEEVDAVHRPVTVLGEVLEDFRHELQSRRGVWVGDEFAQLVEGFVPLVGFFVEIGDPEA